MNIILSAAVIGAIVLAVAFAVIAIGVHTWEGRDE